MASALKTALEDLLRARKLQAEAPPLRGYDRWLAPFATGIAALDALLGGGFPRGRVSEVYGPSSSGRTGVVFALVARATHGGAFSAWVDPGDRLDPASAAAAGVDLARLFWLRGERAPRALASSIAATNTLLGSGLFEQVILDLAGVCEVGRLPSATWLRLQRTVGDTKAALVLLADAHLPHGANGASLELRPVEPRWSGPPGPGRLLRGLAAEALTDRHGRRRAALELQA